MEGGAKSKVNVELPSDVRAYAQHLLLTRNDRQRRARTREMQSCLEADAARRASHRACAS